MMATADTLTYPTASALRDCLAEQAVDSVFGPVADKAVRFGAAGGATMDGCDCESAAGNGRASVRVAQVVPANLHARSDRVGAGVRAQRCGNVWTVTYELTIVRCFPMSSDGRPLPASEVDQTAQRFLSDQAAIMRAINCCEYLDRHSGVELVNLGPIGPAGGCAGNQGTIRVVQARG
jgi:hypothetical protein